MKDQAKAKQSSAKALQGKTPLESNAPNIVLNIITLNIVILNIIVLNTNIANVIFLRRTWPIHWGPCRWDRREGGGSSRSSKRDHSDKSFEQNLNFE